MITAKHRKKELTQGHVVRKVESKRSDDIRKSASKQQASLPKKSLFPIQRKRGW